MIDFRFQEKRKKGLLLALDFRDLIEREFPNFKEIKNLDFAFLNFKNNFIEFLKKKKKIIYSFQTRERKKEIKNIFETLRDLEKINLFKNIFFELEVLKVDEDLIYKEITFLRKEIVSFFGKDYGGKVKILLKNNFSEEENLKLLKNKILKISGIIIKDGYEK